MAEVIRPSGESILVPNDSVGLQYNPIEKHHFWMKWIHASVNKHFTDNKGNLPMYLEGDERTDIEDNAEFYELRIDGPFILQPHKNLWFLDIEINVLVQTHMDSRQLYNNSIAMGPMLKAMSNTICVYKYGEDVLDDQSVLGILHLQRGLDERVDINYFGIIRPDTRLTQSTIEGHYRMEINSNGTN